MDRKEPRIGPKMALVLQFVEDNPGLCMRRAALVAGPSQGTGYDVVYRCLRAGLLRKEPGPVTSSWLLFLPKKRDTDESNQYHLQLTG